MEFHEGALVTLVVASAASMGTAGRALQQISHLTKANQKLEDRVVVLERNDADPSRNRSPDWESEVRRRLTSIESVVEVIRTRAEEDRAAIMTALGDIRVQIVGSK